MLASELFELGCKAFTDKQYQQAVDIFKQSIALKKNWSTYQSLGVALYKMQEYQQAIDAFKQALALKADWNSYQGLASALYRIQQYKPAIDAFKKSLALQEDWSSYQGLGWALYWMQNHQSAIDAFKESLALKKDWNTYQSLGVAMLGMQQHQQAVDAFRQSLLLKKDWNTYHSLGRALHKMQEYQQAVNAFKKSLVLKENWSAYQGLGLALYELGKTEQGVKATRIFYKQQPLHLKINPFLGARHNVTVTRNTIERIQKDFLKIQFAFHPSFLPEDEDDNQLHSWRHLIHIHIPKCAGSNFEYPLSILPNYLKNALKTKTLNCPEYEDNNYLWHGNLEGKCLHDAFILEAFKGANTDRIQGSFFANHHSKHRIYSQKLSEAGNFAQKVCLLRDPAQRLYSHIRHLGRTSYNKNDLLKQCMEELPNLMDRYIYDYDLFKGQKEDPYCNPTDYENCESINFLDISDDFSISRVKSAFLSATLMPNIVQYNRLNDDKNKSIARGCLGEKDFQDIHKELLLRGCLERDNLIDLEYLKKRTRERLIFPEIIRTGIDLHPITLLINRDRRVKIMPTTDFIADPLNSLDF